MPARTDATNRAGLPHLPVVVGTGMPPAHETHLTPVESDTPQTPSCPRSRRGSWISSANLETQPWPCFLQQLPGLPQIAKPPEHEGGELAAQTAAVTHDACAAASGATIDSITGRRSEIPAARRRVRSMFRREYWAASAGSVTGSVSKCVLPKRSSAIHTTASSIGVANCSSSSAATSATLVCPSQCCQTRAAV